MFASPDWGLGVLKFSPIFGVLSIISATDNARKSIKGSIDADFGLVSEKILNHNNGPMGWGSGPGKGSQKHPHL